MKNDFSERVLLLEHLWHLGKGIIHSLINSHHSECHCSESVQLAASGSDDIFDFNWKAGPWLLREWSLPNSRGSALVHAFITRHERSKAPCKWSEASTSVRVCFSPGSQLLSLKAVRLVMGFLTVLPGPETLFQDGVLTEMGACLLRELVLEDSLGCACSPCITMSKWFNLRFAATSSDSPGGCNKNCEKTELWSHRNQAVRHNSGCPWKSYSTPTSCRSYRQ